MQATAPCPDRQESSGTVHSWEAACDSGWDVSPGDLLSLQGPGTRRISGIVDDISPDGMFLWLFLDDGGGRRLFHWLDGYATAGAQSGRKHGLDQP